MEGLISDDLGFLVIRSALTRHDSGRVGFVIIEVARYAGSAVVLGHRLIDHREPPR